MLIKRCLIPLFLLIVSMSFITAVYPDGASINIRESQIASPDTHVNITASGGEVLEIAFDEMPYLEILSPAQNQIIHEDELELQFKIEDDKEIRYCEFGIYSIKQSNKEKEFEEIFDLIEGIYSARIKDFKNGDYFVKLTCVDNNSQEASKKVDFKIDMPNNPNDIEESNKEERDNKENIETETSQGEENLIQEAIKSESTNVEDYTITSISNNKNECTNGCSYDGKCIPFGTRVMNEDGKVYCDIAEKLELQKEEGESCQNDYECLSGECNNEECFNLQKNLEATGKAIENVSSKVDENTNVLKKLIDFLKNLFGFE